VTSPVHLSKAVRTQIAAAVHLIAQVNRMRDGVRRVTHIMEVVGMEGDTITTQEPSRSSSRANRPMACCAEFSNRMAFARISCRRGVLRLDRPLLEVI